jgi:drug/metabolite transporter (DMT)-like permease
MAFLGERIARHGWLGIALASLGAMLVLGVGPEELGADSSKAIAGGLIFMITMLTWSGFNVVTKIVVSNGTPPLAVATGSMMFQIIGLLILVPFEHAAGTSFSWSGWTVFGILYMSILGTVLAFLAVSWALERLEGSRAGAVYYVEQVVGVAAAWLLLNEEPGPSFAIGGLLVLGGVYMVTRSQVRRQDAIVASVPTFTPATDEATAD